MTEQPYQVMPPLDDDQRHALRQSIAANGVLQPVEIDEDGTILDGHHRAEIAGELGIDYPTRVVSGLADDAAKRQYAITINVARRQLNASARSGYVAQLRTQGMSIRQIARETGLSKTTVARDLGQVSQVGHLPDSITGADGKRYAANRPAPTPQTPATSPEPEPAGIDVPAGSGHQLPDDVPLPGLDEPAAGSCSTRGEHHCDIDCLAAAGYLDQDDEQDDEQDDGPRLPDGGCTACLDQTCDRHCIECGGVMAEHCRRCDDCDCDGGCPADDEQDPTPDLSTALTAAIDQAIAKAKQQHADQQALTAPREVVEAVERATFYVPALVSIEHGCKHLLDSVADVDPEQAVADLPPHLLSNLDGARQAHAFLSRVVAALDRIGVPA